MAKVAIIAETPATITDRGQTTVPAAIRRKLALGKRDHILFREMSDGTILLAKQRAGTDAPDPALTGFLTLLANDIARHPDRLRPIDEALVSRARALVEGVEVDLDVALPDDVT